MNTLALKSLLLVLLVLLLNSITISQQLKRSGSKTPSISQNLPPVSMVGKPFWWLKHGGGVGGNDAYLYFGVILENKTKNILKVGVNFRSYLPDGTEFDGCFGFGEAGASTEILPNEKALLACNKTRVSRDLKNLQVTVRIDYLSKVQSSNLLAEVVEAKIISSNRDESPPTYTGAARVRTTSERDIRTRTVFRFYSRDGIQVGTCQSGDEVVEPEVVLKTSCFNNLVVLSDTYAPYSVKAEIRPPLF